MEKKILTALLPEELAAFFADGVAYRGRQLFKWIYAGARAADDMKNVPKEIRAQLQEKAVFRSSTVSCRLEDPDGTVKLQITLADGCAVETVLLCDEEGRKTACVSCQTGCAMACAFCKTGSLGFTRNLSAAEIVEQFLFLEDDCGKLDNIVFMGMGEPLLNLDEIRRAVEILCHPEGRNLSRRRITLSTAGIIAGIYDLADNGPDIRLAVSLTVADDEIRSSLMPVNKANPLEKLRAAIAYYSEKTGSRCTLEAVLLSGINTSDECARQLAGFAKSLNAHVNLIPWNPAPGLQFKEPSGAQTAHIRDALEKAGVTVTVRTRRGRKIGGACGQLGKTMDAADGQASTC